MASRHSEAETHDVSGFDTRIADQAPPLSERNPGKRAIATGNHRKRVAGDGYPVRAAALALADILQNRRDTEINGDDDPRYVAALINLHVSVVNGGSDPRFRLEAFNEDMKTLRRMLDEMCNPLDERTGRPDEDKQAKQWVVEQIDPYEHAIREGLNKDLAEKRVAEAVLLRNGAVAEDGSITAEQEIGALDEGISHLEVIVSLAPVVTRSVLKELGKSGEEGAEKLTRFQAAVDQLAVLKGILVLWKSSHKMTDEEFAERAAHTRGLEGVASRIAVAAEAVKIAGGVVTVTAGFAGWLAQLAKQPDLARKAFDIAGQTSSKLVVFTVYADVLRSILVLLNSSSSVKERATAVSHLQSAALFNLGRLAGGTVGGLLFMIGPAYIKFVAEFAGQSYAGVRMGTGFDALHRYLEYVGEQYQGITEAAASTQKAWLLAGQEQDASQRAALESVTIQETARLCRRLDDFLTNCVAQTRPGHPGYPGRYEVTRKRFAAITLPEDERDTKALLDTAAQVISAIEASVADVDTLIEAFTGLKKKSPEELEREKEEQRQRENAMKA